ncbi:hypothetical protein [Streptomyces sp. KMM 9044]|uniref:hypothetical protein n=1 Tax=Streptomyces sp. KMM 9044 TaxID=2744474 RepID=UPI003FA7BE53
MLLDAPDEVLGPVLVGAAGGDPAPAVGLLSATRHRGAWEHRDRYVRKLAVFARSRPEWLDTWRARDPYNPDGLLVDAQRSVHRAWDSPVRAELLREVSPLITAAARADHRDPVPWRLALDHARGTRAGHRYFQELWEAAVRRAPHHYGCHGAALRCLSSSWQGAHLVRFDFADQAAQDAPDGSLTQALPLQAAFGYLTDGGGRPRSGPVRPASGSPPPAGLRNLLAYVLLRLERGPDALEQLRLTGPYATSTPWDREAEDPLGRFLEVRRGLSEAVAAGPAGAPPAGPRHPRSERGGRARFGDH